MSRQGSRKFETSFVNHLSILFHKCGIRFSGPLARDHGTPPNACYSTLIFGAIIVFMFFEGICLDRVMDHAPGSGMGNSTRIKISTLRAIVFWQEGPFCSVLLCSFARLRPSGGVVNRVAGAGAGASTFAKGGVSA